ncbi:MAG: PAS domain S-box protein [Thermodesulfobacteriota bacterium]
MKLRSLGSIRLQVVFLVLVAMLPAALLLYHQAKLERAQAVSKAESQAVHIARLIQSEGERLIEGTRQLLTGLSRMPCLENRDYEQCSQVFAKVIRDFPQYANIGMTDASGMAIASAISLQGPMSLSDRTWFRRAKEEKRFAVGEFQVSRVANKPTINLALPVYEKSGELLAVLVAALDLEALNPAIARFPIPEGSTVTLLDYSGAILSRFPANPSLLGRRLESKNYYNHFIRHPPGTLFQDRGTDGVWRYYVTARLLYEPGQSGLFLCVGLPEKGIFDEADALFFRSLLTTGLAFAAILVLAWALSGLFFTRKIRQLVSAARRFGSGDTDARSGIGHTSDEIGELARSFDEMAEALSRHIVEADTANKQISFQKTLLQCQSEASPEGIVVVSPDGRWLYTNRRFREMWRIPEDIISRQDANEAIGWAANNMVADPAKWKRAALEMRADPDTEQEDEITLRDGRVFLQQTAPVRDEQGRHYGRVYYHRDITREKANQERFARLVTAMDQSAEEIIMTDAAGIIEYVNPAFSHITGYDRDEALGKTPSFLSSGEHDDQFFADLWNVISRGGIWKGRLVNLRKDGKKYIKEATISPVRDPKGMIVNYVSVGRDVTEKVEMERSLRQAQKLEAIGTLAGGIAHDFNNILAAMMGYTELTAMEFSENERAASYLAEVLKAGRRAEDLVRQILLFSRQAEQEKRPVLLQPVIKEALKLLRGSLPSHIEMAIEISSDCGPVNADPTQIHQVIMNLATNAYHAMREKGGVLSVSLSETMISPEQAEAGGLAPGIHARIEVADTGTGIPEIIKKRIFDPYFSTKKPDEGTGLGLSTVHGIVKSHHGAVSVVSQPGKGSSFVILLPLAGDQEAAHEPEAGPEPARQASGRVLFVDDETALVDLGKRLLSTCGFSVTAFEDPKLALETFSKNPEAFDVVLSDVLMPRMSGLSLAEKIHEIRPDLPIVFCTGFSESLSRETLAAAGITAVIMKPILRNEIRDALVKAIAERKSKT